MEMHFHYVRETIKNTILYTRQLYFDKRKHVSGI